MDSLKQLDKILKHYDVVLGLEYPNHYYGELWESNGQLADCHANTLADLIARLDQAGADCARTD